MTPQRHELVWLGAAGWRQVHAGPWDEAARACLAHWTDAGLPLVTTRQGLPDRLALGLPAPLRFDRRRLAIEIARDDRLIARRGRFPRAAEALVALPDVLRPHGLALDQALGRLGCAARVYGGFGWQRLTGLAYLHRDSDIDLLLPVADAAMADAVCAALTAAEALPAFAAGPRLDGELLVGANDDHAGDRDGGSAGIAWREWRSWRRGEVDQVLAKRIDGVALERPLGAGRPAA